MGNARRNVTGTVKWFNPSKGFGFITLDDGSPDVFCHASVVGQAGYDALEQGATVVCDITQGHKGPQVSRIASVDMSTATPMERRPFRREDAGGPPRGPRRGPPGMGGGMGGGMDRFGETVEGRVKFFNAEKGFGFVTLDDGGDVFVHAKTLERSGVHELPAACRVRLTTRQGPKGLQAQSVEIIDDDEGDERGDEQPDLQEF
ncbi:MAG: cold shock domain-containing protein [Alphaproteobacteria bacterium]|jgi:CspA family cold shock protein|nr:cold shock domain-containing protein [Alphaproteobacteria bacterium]